MIIISAKTLGTDLKSTTVIGFIPDSSLNIAEMMIMAEKKLKKIRSCLCYESSGRPMAQSAGK